MIGYPSYISLGNYFFLSFPVLILGLDSVLKRGELSLCCCPLSAATAQTKVTGSLFSLQPRDDLSYFSGMGIEIHVTWSRGGIGVSGRVVQD